MNLMRRKRLDLDITQAEVAKRTKIVYSTISMFERGHVQPSEKQKQKLAKVLKCSIDELFPNETKD